MAGWEERFDDYVERLGDVLGHADRRAPLRAYTTGLLLPGERKSVEPMAARVDPARVGAAHQSLARGHKPRASYGKWAKPLREGHGKTQRFRHASVSLRPRSVDAAPACPGFLTRCQSLHHLVANAARDDGAYSAGTGGPISGAFTG